MTWSRRRRCSFFFFVLIVCDMPRKREEITKDTKYEVNIENFCGFFFFWEGERTIGFRY